MTMRKLQRKFYQFFVCFSAGIFSLITLLVLLTPQLTFAHGLAGTIHLLQDHYDPQMATIYKGEKLVFKNDSSEKRWPDVSFQSTPKHPADHYAPDQPLAPGQIWLYKFQYSGTWQYIDKENTQIHGTITVIVGRG